MQRLFDFYNACYNYTISQESLATEFPNALVVKSHLKQVDQIVRSLLTLTDVCFAYKEKETQHRCSLSFKPNRIRFLPSLL